MASAAAVNAQINPPLTAAERAARSVFVGNIPYEATEEQLKDIFAQVGPVVSFRLVYDRETGKPKGYGFCEYQDVETAQSAMRNLNNHDFNGRPLRVGVAAGEQNKDDMKSMQQAVGGAPVESPFGDPIEPTKAPEAISRAVASLPPEQMFELMKQMKLCIQNNPNEARNMLLQNPQLAYALLQAQIVMKIVDPQVAMAMLHRQTEAIPPLLPSANNGGNDDASDTKVPTSSGPPPSLPASLSIPSQSSGPPSSMASSFDRDPMGPATSRGGLLGEVPLMGRNAPPMGPGPPRMPYEPRGMPMDIGPPDGGMSHDQDMRGPPRDMGDMGPRGMGRDMGPRDMGPRDMGGPRDVRMRDMDPRDMGRPGMGIPRSMAGPPDMGPRGAPPRDVRDPRAMGGDPRGMDPRVLGPPDPRDPRAIGDHRSMPDRPMGDPRGMPDHRGMGGDMGRPMDRDHRLDPRGMGGGMDPRGRGPPPVGPPPPRPQPNLGALSGLGNLAGAAASGGGQTQDKEKAALIMQVLQLSDQQIDMLPPDQRRSILILKEQISRSTGVP